MDAAQPAAIKRPGTDTATRPMAASFFLCVSSGRKQTWLRGSSNMASPNGGDGCGSGCRHFETQHGSTRFSRDAAAICVHYSQSHRKRYQGRMLAASVCTRWRQSPWLTGWRSFWKRLAESSVILTIEFSRSSFSNVIRAVALSRVSSTHSVSR